MRFTGGSRAFLLLADPFASDDLFLGTTTPSGDLVAITIWLGQSGEGEGQIGAGIQLGIDAFGALTVDAKDPLIVLPAVARPRP